MARHFTLDAARALLPRIGRLIRDSVQAKARYQESEAYLRELGQRILMTGGMAIDTSAVEVRRTQRESSAQLLKQSLDEIEELGILVKDLNVGLVDFPTLYLGEEVYLCWRMDEDDIGYWHGVHEGFAGRKEIDEHFIRNHRGPNDAGGDVN
ncbi:MAG: DUF2203 domain-containing protein [Acidobacteriota bacterium]|nr:DUF2203 domain-containing protein [Acidobacteriota bacterium]